MKIFFALPLMAALLCAAAGLRPDAALAVDAAAREIMTRVYDHADGEDRRFAMTMTLTNRQGRQRIRTVESFSKDYGRDRKSVMIFLAPADVKGTMYLSWEYENPGREDDKWLYMPALRKDRRISGASRNEYFMGSDFTYDDIGRRHPAKDAQRRLGEETVNGFACWKIECVPLDPSETYTRRVAWVAKEAGLVIKAEYHDKDGLLKTFTALDVRKQDGFWNIYLCEMVNAVTGHKTEMKIASLLYDTGLDDALFTVATLQRGRI
ncbi:MAG: outer membrane lipoprotein-sorting protein [Desulfovibrio sp.]|nr:outer membrane lipoprotein-sorting protein [Desulfovibrio sp.]